MAKAAPAPAVATMIPPSAGPTLRIRLNPIEFSDTASGRFSRGTISPIDACQDGLFSAVPVPKRKVKPSRTQGVSRPAKAATASATDTLNMKTCATSRIRRLS